MRLPRPWLMALAVIAPLASLGSILMSDTLGWEVATVGFPVVAGVLSASYALLGGRGMGKTALIGVVTGAFTAILWLPMLALFLLVICSTGIGCVAG